MGGRLLRQWLRYPLCDLEHIEARQGAIAAFLEAGATLKQIVEKMEGVCDIERVIGRVALGRVGPRDLAGLGRCLGKLPELFDLLASLKDSAAVSPEWRPPGSRRGSTRSGRSPGGPTAPARERRRAVRSCARAKNQRR